jgi:hypothetical protein
MDGYAVVGSKSNRVHEIVLINAYVNIDSNNSNDESRMMVVRTMINSYDGRTIIGYIGCSVTIV